MMFPPQSRRRVVLVLLVVLLLGVAGAWRWHAMERNAQVVAGLPAEPSLESAPAELRFRIAECQDRVRNGPRSLQALGELSRLYCANGFLEQAIHALTAMSQLEPQEPRWLHLRANLLAGAGRLEEAIPLLKDVAKRAPNYLPARIRLGDALLKNNQAPAAEAVYQAVLTGEPTNRYALLGAARCEIELKQAVQAEKHLQQAVAADPRYSPAWILLAGLYEQRGDAAASLNAQAEATQGSRFHEMPDPWFDELWDDSYDPYRLRIAASIAEEAGSTPDAVRLLERVLRLYPEDAAAHREFGRLLLKQHDFRNAKLHLDRAVALVPSDSENWIGLLKWATEAGDPGAAEAAVLAGLSHCPASPTLRLEHGRQLVAKNQPEEAMAEFAEARKLRPTDPDALVEIALVYLKRGDMDRGMAELRSVLAVQPNHPMALLALARQAIVLGDEKAATGWMQRLGQQSRLRAEDAAELLAAFRERFGHTP